MKSPKFLLFASLCCAASVHAKGPSTVAHDDATQSAYTSGWNESGGGNGFGEWKFQQVTGTSNSYAGHFIASGGESPEKAPVATDGKAFGLFANGSDFESIAAFRAFSNPLKTGDTFSFQMVNIAIEQKGDSDSPAAGAIGLTLRNGNASDTHDDYNKNSRFEIIQLKGTDTYQIYDGESGHDSGVKCSDGGIAVSVTLTGADTYDLEITRLVDKKTTKLKGRKFAGSGSVDSLCVFDRNGEKADGFFNNFEVSSGGK